jgi:resuscitation-promoting factor RpfA
MVPSGAPTFPELSGGDPLASDPRARLTPYPGPAPMPLPVRPRAAPPPAPPPEPLLEPTPAPIPAVAPVPVEVAPPVPTPTPFPLPAPPPSLPAPLAGPVPEPAPPPVRSPSRPEPRPAADRPAAGTAAEVHLRRAASWRRVVAWGVDLAVVMGIVVLVLVPVLGRGDLPPDWSLDAVVEGLTRRGSVLLPAVLLAGVVGFAYEWLCTALAGATAGKWVTGLRVVGPDGRRPLPGRSAVRSLLVLPSVGLLGMGGLLALFTRSGRSAHDFLAGTWVVRAGVPTLPEGRP